MGKLNFLDQNVRSPGQVKFETSPRHRHQSSRSHCEQVVVRIFDTVMERYIYEYLQNLDLEYLILETSSRVNFGPAHSIPT